MKPHSIDIKPEFSESITIEPLVPLSPRTKHMQNELKLELKRERYDNTWDSCCFRLDRRAAMFFSQLFISLLVMVFCLYQLLTKSSCETDALYSGLLTLILGVYLPQPKIKK